MVVALEAFGADPNIIEFTVPPSPIVINKDGAGVTQLLLNVIKCNWYN
jgi:hypothetical protein